MVMPRPDGLTSDQMMTHIEILSTRHRILFLSGYLGMNSVGQIIHDTSPCDVLLSMASISKEPIKIFISSPGGLVTSMLTFYDTIKTLGVPIYTIGRFCASAGTVLLAAGTKRYLQPHAKVMLHLISGGMEGGLELMQVQAREAKRDMDVMVDLLQECGVKCSRTKIRKDIRVDKWMTAQEAIDYGLADEILTKEIMQEWLKDSGSKTRHDVVMFGEE